MVTIAAPTWAQETYGVGRQSLREKRDAARAAKEAEKAAKTEVAATYPAATRQEPEAKASRNGLKRLQALQEKYQRSGKQRLREGVRLPDRRQRSLRPGR